MLKRFIGNNGTREHGPSIQVLRDERENLEDALKLATEGYKTAPVEVSGQKHEVRSNGYGTEIKPA